MPRRRRLTTEERDALVCAPVGTKGLAALGLTDPDFADLLNLGPKAREQAAEAWSSWHAMKAQEEAADLVGHMNAMTTDDKRQFLAILAASLGGE